MSVNKDSEQDSAPRKARRCIQQGTFVVDQGHGHVTVARPEAVEKGQVIRHFIMRKPRGMGGELLNTPEMKGVSAVEVFRSVVFVATFSLATSG